MVPCTSSKQQIWVCGDLRNMRLLQSSCNVLAKARGLATELNHDLVFILFYGEEERADEEKFGGRSPSAAEAADIAVEHGADHVFCFESYFFNPPQAHVIAVALAEAIEVCRPTLCLFALTDFGRELSARTAAIGGLGLMADCAEMILEKGRIVGLCPAWSGTIVARIAFADACKTGLATVQPHGNRPQPTRGNPGIFQRQRLDMDYLPTGIRMVAREVEPDCQRQLEEAQIVVAGGMGLSSPQGFELLGSLAAALGAEVAATRPPVLKGWVAEERMLGQTGKSVRPELLVSVGTSGAVQYTAGIIESGFIVAINHDPAAPIFQVADIGVIADASVFVPLLIEKSKQAVMRSLASHWCSDSDHNGSIPLGTFGEKLCRLRQAQQWSYAELAEATGQLPEFIEKAEKDMVLPPVGFLLRLASVLKVSPDTFLDQRHRFSFRKDCMTALVRRTQSSAYRSLTNDADHDHLRAFLITIDPCQSHKPVAYKHEGEEFIFVQSGVLELRLGNEVFILEAGASRHFHSNTPHKLKSLSDHSTECLVVLYTL